MRIAFYAPMKPPDHPVPSGDRHMARLFQQALAHSGHQVDLACRLRSRDPNGDFGRQERLRRLGTALADRLVRRYRSSSPADRPQVWFTYHLYYKAPDWVGPRVCERLGIPYLVAEASVANKRAGGPWDPGHRATLTALAQSAAVITVNPHDAICLPTGSQIETLDPFLETSDLRMTGQAKAAARRALADRHGLAHGLPWLLTVAMMRRGDKLASYRLLAKAVTRLQDRSWQLLLVGDGPARAAVEEAFATVEPGRVRFLGEGTADGLRELYAASDLCAWPAVNEAYGMALLEAQAAGLPVVAARTGGVPAIVEHNVTGLLAAPQDVSAFAECLGALLDCPERRRSLSAAAVRKTTERHDLATAAARLDAILQQAVRKGMGRESRS